MDVLEQSSTVDPEVRAHVYSLVSAVCILAHDEPTMAVLITRLHRLAETVTSMMASMYSEMMPSPA